MKCESKNNSPEHIKVALEYANGILATAREPILILSKDLRVISANRAYYSTFKAVEKETIGRHLSDIGNGQWNIPELTKLLKRILPKKTIVNDYDVSHDFENIGHRDIRLNSCKLRISKEVALAITGEGGRKKEEELILLAIEDVTEDKKINEELRRLDQLKSQFVANVSHELLNPLSIIKQSVKLILDGISGSINKKQESILSRTMKTADRLVRLVSNLLVVAKIESGTMDLKMQEFDLRSLLEQTLVDYVEPISEKKLIVRKNMPSEGCMMWGDSDKITEVIINLLGNAIKYTPEGGTISISIGVTENIIRCSIANTGSGIPREYADKIFDKFERIASEKESGTGLGLPIAKDIIKLHGGKIWVESTLGHESRFVFTLPRDFRKGVD